jgi:hypothetical protein
MRILGRLLLDILALVLAIPTGAVVLSVALATMFGEEFLRMAPDFLDLMVSAAIVDPLIVAEGFATLLFQILPVLLLLPPALTLLAGEILDIRSILFHAGLTGVVTAALPFLLRSATRAATPEEIRLSLALGIAGLASGTMTWLIAGRSAGFSRPEPVMR